MPNRETHIITSKRPPTGVRDPGVAPLAQTLSDAFLAADGTRYRAFPVAQGISLHVRAKKATRDRLGHRRLTLAATTKKAATSVHYPGEILDAAHSCGLSHRAIAHSQAGCRRTATVRLDITVRALGFHPNNRTQTCLFRHFPLSF